MSDTTSIRTYYYNEQFKKYFVQFMAIFGGMRVGVGKTGDIEERTIAVPIAFGTRDRVVAALKADNTQNKPLRLPIMSAYPKGYAPDATARKGIGVERRNTYMPTGGLFPDDVEVVHQIMPTPWKVTMELSIYTSNFEQQMQILEQIFMLFDPVLQIQTNDDIFDFTRISTVELVGISPEENYPSGSDKRILQITMDFEFTAHISAPATIKKDYVKDMYMRIGTIGTGTETSEDILAELDIQGFEYDLVYSVDDIKLEE